MYFYDYGEEYARRGCDARYELYDGWSMNKMSLADTAFVLMNTNWVTIKDRRSAKTGRRMTDAEKKVLAWALLSH